MVRIEPGLVMVRLPPGRAFLDALDASWHAGDAVAPVDPGIGRQGLRALREELRPHTLVDASGTDHYPDGEPVPAGTALVVPTSGTTGHPKGVALSHEALEASVRASLERVEANAGERWLCCLPTHHVAGISALARSRTLGTEPLIHPRFDPQRLAAACRAGQAQHVSLVPTQLLRALDAGVDLSGLRTVLLGGAPAPAGLLERAAAAGVRVVSTYGMTETCGGCVYDGRPLDGVEVRVGEDGRIRLRGPVRFTGYHRRPDLDALALEDGWLVTDDLGRLVDGRLEVLGRADEAILTGGETVSAEAVATALRRHPGVADAAVAGRAHPEWGEEVVAWCVAAGPARPHREALRATVADTLGRHSAPRVLHWVEEIPRGPLGKVLREELPDAR